MGKTTGFLEYDRRNVGRRPAEERIKDFADVMVPMPEDELLKQAARCMDCGIPFCHGTGCPLQNKIPEFNELVYQGRWRDASEVLHSTNNFPEFTGRVCPALCEASCTLALEQSPVTIEHIEMQIVERAFEQGWIEPLRPVARTGRKVAIVGSGPAGLAAAQQLNRAGHEVVLFEKDDRVGGLLRYGIPDFKLPKWIIDRRVEQMASEGVRFEPSCTVGRDISAKHLRKSFDAVLLTMGAGQPRSLDCPGHDLDGVHYALEYLIQQNREVAGDAIQGEPISAYDKHVVVIGGGDTGSDCVGTAIRQEAKSVTQIEILPKSPQTTNPATPWPLYPRIHRTSTSHEEGCERRWCIMTKELTGKDGKVEKLLGCEVEWTEDAGRWDMKELPGSEFTLDADLVLLSMGFLHVTHGGLIDELGIEHDERGNIVVDENKQTTEKGIFAAGDSARGASLVVWAIDEGRQAAEAVSAFLR